ncbi:hypothetical protein VP1G_05200 [Cytospora mali]|uniref:Cyclochlorotine biosynthesis protein O n=1 Tax=Cytospora mali TaxID=578113 RepID=A0A194V1T1_CYTMA|nr:hypothetical protein VP1G_05200 [Valsa mali var. pyri (nom. inval.)]
MDNTRSSSSTEYDEERQTLFSDKENGTRWSSVPPTSGNTTRAFTWTSFYILVLHIALIWTGTLLWLCNRKDSDFIPLTGRSWSPVHPFIEYEVRADNTSLYNTQSKYSGPPSEEIDGAWWELVKPALFNASVEEIERAGESLEDVAEVTMGGYLAGLGVYHELHCLQRIRTYVHEYYYYPQMSDTERIILRHHIDHCIQLLRSTVMCHGTTDFEVFFWGENSDELPEARSSAKRVCVKWDSLHNWSRSRFVRGDEPPVKPRPEG